ncbi:hypothetical protein E4631_11305 [Hymenobacter sp. UV11]|uniref:hypothetical protein n=1 Tax=Hymenobacter sp. UV11 TaxID=1849735 RepID=UPI001061E364|nr:hypothetical protein [Hymenobacter sp. UV11]TDN40405.1 hypothetical protein A8B98_13250 [Hymenobacter sp. UV11]TFZ66592.1 hypothetical protein E4631_11305 [Hymenobacter sp. UV11]
MRQYDNLDDDDLADDDNLDEFARTGGAKTKGSSEDQLSAKYADYLMWRDTGSSHDEALDLASMTEEEFTTAEAAEDPDGISGLAPLEDDDDLDADDDDDSFGSSSRSRGSSNDYDSDY